MKTKILIFLILWTSTVTAQSFLNPIENKSYLRTDKFKVFNQTSFFSIMNNNFSYSGGYNLTSLQYNISGNLVSYFHFTKSFNFSKDNDFRNENFLPGATFIYKPSGKLNLGLEYGVTPDSINYFQFSPANNYLHMWLNKKIGNNINIQIEYYQVK